MSESRNNSESRGSRYTPSYVSRPSESRDTGESRCSYSSNNFSSESRNDSESRYDSRGQVNNTRYNNLDGFEPVFKENKNEELTPSQILEKIKEHNILLILDARTKNDTK